MHRTPQTRHTMDAGFLNDGGLVLVLVLVPEEPVGGPAGRLFLHSWCAGAAGDADGGFCTYVEGKQGHWHAMYNQGWRLMVRPLI
jgi:hypothetical protein